MGRGGGGGGGGGGGESLKACMCKVGARIKRKGGAFSGAHKVVEHSTQGQVLIGEKQWRDKLCGLHVLMGENKCPTQGETNFVGFTCSWERTSAQHKERGLVQPPTLSRGGLIEEQLI